MKFNLFEGARRIGYVFIALCTLIAGGILLDTELTLKSVFFAALFPIFAYIFVLVVGWIARGFLGIPMGKDFKE